MDKSKLREVYKVMLKEPWIIEYATWAVLGPIHSGKGITDQEIMDLREGRGSAIAPYAGGLEQNIAIPARAGPLVEDDLDVLREKSQAEGYDPSRWFELAGDILLLAQAGVLKRDNFSDSTHLYYWKLNERFTDLAHSSRAVYCSTLRELLKSPGERNPGEEDLAKYDEMIMEAYRR